MELNERIRKLRRALDLTQQKFGERIGVKQNTVAQYEIARNTPTDTVISLICREFNVSEDWLRTGEGEMFVKKEPDEELLEWAGKVLVSESDTFQKRFLEMLSKLSDEEWKTLEKFFNLEVLANKEKKEDTQE